MPVLDAVLDDLDLLMGRAVDAGPGMLSAIRIVVPVLLLRLLLFTISFTTAAMGLGVPRGEFCTRGET